MEKVLIKNLACCKNKVAPQFGCTDRYYKKKYNRNKNYKKYRSTYKYRKSRKKYYVKNYKTKRPFRPKRKLTKCTCYNREKLGHIAKDCKLPKNPKRKQIAEIIMENEKYTQIEYVDYDLESEDSIYEISENEIDNDIELESDNELYNIND